MTASTTTTGIAAVPSASETELLALLRFAACGQVLVQGRPELQIRLDSGFIAIQVQYGSGDAMARQAVVDRLAALVGSSAALVEEGLGWYWQADGTFADMPVRVFTRLTSVNGGEDR
ncbi:hypothetical protein GXW82_44510 [Streptacidiphilus sp. 4-A2]|nr:hypothetical protein [Streptacidiphilus sp. 4-A2]